MKIHVRFPFHFLLVNLILDAWVLYGIIQTFDSKIVLSLTLILLFLSHLHFYLPQRKFPYLTFNLKRGDIYGFSRNNRMFRLVLIYHFVSRYFILMQVSIQDSSQTYTILLTSISQNPKNWRTLSYFLRQFSFKKVAII